MLASAGEGFGGAVKGGRGGASAEGVGSDGREEKGLGLWISPCVLSKEDEPHAGSNRETPSRVFTVGERMCVAHMAGSLVEELASSRVDLRGRAIRSRRELCRGD